MALVHYEPINLFDRFSNEFNRFATDALTQNAIRQERNWVPAVDILEEDGRFILCADIPGVERKDVDITLENDVLTIKGERQAAAGEKREGFQRRERVHGSFMRQFTMPDTVNDENISATVKDGVLQIEIPKQEKPKPRTIAIV